MDDKERQLDLLKRFEVPITSTWGTPNAEDFRQCFLFVEDYSKWVSCLTAFPQSILFESSLNECATANFFCSLGLYKHAMISLRLCIEHCLFGIQLSTNDYAFRNWKMGNKDMSWTAIIDPNCGIFSKQFIRAYAMEFEERHEELNNIAKNVYRECSEFIHGNFEQLNSLPGNNEFDQTLFDKYIELFQNCSYLLSVALLIRFKEYIFNNDLLSALEEPIMHNIGTLPEVQFLYSKDGDSYNE